MAVIGLYSAYAGGGRCPETIKIGIDTSDACLLCLQVTPPRYTGNHYHQAACQRLAADFFIDHR